MVYCKYCGNLDENRLCSWYNATMSEATIKRGVPCDGYKKRKKQ